jgi:hypothetical protein
MKRETKLKSQEQEEQVVGQQSQEQSAIEFATPEDMLRHDALHTPVPPSIAHRLQQSLNQTAPAAQSLWRRLFGSR